MYSYFALGTQMVRYGVLVAVQCFGQERPLHVRKTEVICAGNLRYELDTTGLHKCVSWCHRSLEIKGPARSSQQYQQLQSLSWLRVLLCFTLFCLHFVSCCPLLSVFAVAWHRLGKLNSAQVWTCPKDEIPDTFQAIGVAIPADAEDEKVLLTSLL